MVIPCKFLAKVVQNLQNSVLALAEFPMTGRLCLGAAKKFLSNFTPNFCPVKYCL